MSINFMGVEDEAANMNFRNVIATALISSFGFLIALFWRDAVTATINKFLPEGEGLAYQYGIAILVTIIAVIVIFLLARYLKTAPKEKK